MTLLIGMIALEVVRFLIFCICYLFGYRVWIFPDLDREDKGILGVFTPFISVEVQLLDPDHWQKIEDGYNKYRYIVLGVLGAILAMYAYNPRGFTKKIAVVYNGGLYVGIVYMLTSDMQFNKRRDGGSLANWPLSISLRIRSQPKQKWR